MLIHHARKCSIAFTLIFSMFSCCFCAYIEGIDSTDVNGNCSDPSFRIVNNVLVVDTSSSSNTAIFEDRHYAGRGGYFPFTFDEIKKAPDTLRTNYLATPYITSSFVVRTKDGFYTKIAVVRKNSNGNYIYRFGRNTLPNNLLFAETNYDRRIRYKPNNLYYADANESFHFMRFTWEPPLANDNHLTGYKVYASKSGAIDTSKPVDLAQWDSVGYTVTNNFSTPMMCGYINLVAIYREGNSDFLKGWYFIEPAPGVSNPFPVEASNDLSFTLLRKKNSDYYWNRASFPPGTLPQSATLYSTSGRLVSRVPIGVNAGIFDQSISPGMYLLAVLLNDNRTVTQQIIFTQP
jgi:hypothetical protein